jgi:hypothetical protein
MIDQDTGSLLLKYGTQTLKLPLQSTETLRWYDPPETLNMAMIQMDIGGHPTFPTGSKQFSDNFGNLLFFAVLTSGAILRA